MSQIHQPIGIEPCSVGEGLRLRQFKLIDANELHKLHLDESMTKLLLDDVSLDNLSTVSDFLYGLGKLYRGHPGLGIWAFDKFASRYTREQLIEQGALDFISDDDVQSLVKPQWQLQGWFNLTPVPDHPEQIELGSRLHRGAWGQRIACSIGQKLVDYAFDVLSVPNLYLHCHPENTSALYCAAYLGFTSPKPVRFLGSDALKLSVASDMVSGDSSDSERRRCAVQQVRQWTTAESVAIV